MTDQTYRLSRQLSGHSQDVKAVSVLSNDQILSASRDASARSWNLSSLESFAYTSAHSGFVNAVSSINISGVTYILTAGSDSVISAWLPHSAEPDYALIGHQLNVCCLSVDQESGWIASGSWDKSVRIWKDWSCLATLTGHEQAVWDVLILSGGSGVLTACADNIVRLFTPINGDTARPARTFKGHTQPVRALALLSPTKFASGANDGSIRIWSLTDGSQLMHLDGHDSFVYSLTFISTTNEIASAGEDRSVRVWESDTGKLKQIITLPAISIWSVRALPNGDIATGSSDCIVRVFTRATDRLADQQQLKDYEDTIANSAINANQVGDIKKTDLPGKEALYRPGTKEGQVLMVKLEDGSVEAHQWAMASMSWQKIGTVVDAVGTGRKQLYQGQEYDFVFDVDVKEGSPPLKLPFNVTQNPYEAAQKFLIANNLPAEYADQVVQFIEKNTEGVSIGTGSQSADPYTGAGSYRPGSSAAVPKSQPTRPAPPSSSSFPLRQYQTFATANLPTMRVKLGQFNEQLTAEHSELALDSSKLAQVDSLMESLTRLQATGPTPAGSKLPQEAIDIVLSMLNWPIQLRFPATDLYRLVSLYHSPSTTEVQTLLGNLGGSGKEAETNAMLALRALANTFASRKGELTLKASASLVMAALRTRRTSLNKNGRLVAATVAMNYSVLAIKQDLDKSVGGSFVDLLQDYLQESDPECLHRTLYAVGNLLMSPNVISALSSSTIEKLRSTAVAKGSASPDSRLGSLANDIRAIRLDKS